MRVVFGSHTNLGSQFKVGSYHLSREMAKIGVQTLHIGKPVTPFHLFSRDKKNSLLRLSCAKKGVFQVSENLFECVPLFLHKYCSEKSGPLFEPGVHHLRRLLLRNKFDSADVVFIDEHSFFWLPKLINAKKWIYRPTDNIRDGEPASCAKLILEFADGVVCTSRPLLEQVKGMSNRDFPSVVIANGVDIEHFSERKGYPEEYHCTHKKRVVYVGSLDERFNWSDLEYLAHFRPDWGIYVIGPVLDALPVMPSNVFVLGARDYSEIPKYLQYADVGILPMLHSKQNNSRSPMKLYEYLASGLQVLATRTAELERRCEEGVFLYSDKVELRRAVDQLEGVHPKGANLNIHSWSNKARQLLDFVSTLP